MTQGKLMSLSRRERQIMDIVFQRGRVTAAEVQELLPDPPSYSAVRATLRILEEKGHLTHGREGQRYLFRATVPRGKAQRTALEHLVKTFFDGSAEQVVATLLDVSRQELSDGDLDRLSELIDQARKEGR